MARFEALLVHQRLTTENVAKPRILTAVFVAGGPGPRLARCNGLRELA
jgi:hypothetical protein